MCTRLLDRFPTHDSCTQAHRRLSRSVVLAGLLAVAIVGTVPSVHGQSTTAPSAAETLRDGAAESDPVRSQWKAHFGEQVALLLRTAPSGQMRTSLLHTLIDMAIEEETLDVSEIVPSLVHIVREDEDPERRLLSLQALNLVLTHTSATLDQRTRTHLYNLMQKESSTAVRRAGASMLIAVQEGEKDS